MSIQANLQKFEGRIGYQVIVDRFCKSSRNVPDIPGRKTKDWQDFIPDWEPDSDGVYRNKYFYKGDLKGLTSKLDYLKELGIGLLILGPISETEENHHYDVGGQMKIDPYIGTEEDFKNLCYEAHKRDILIGVDLIFNHMGYNSEIFQKALHGDEKYRKWFYFNPDGSYQYWYDFKNMPLCNQRHPDFQNHAREVVQFYVQNGADMLRLDLGENLDGELQHVIANSAREINPEVLIINERWEHANRDDNYDYYTDMADGVMNYPGLDAIIIWLVDNNVAHFQYNMDRISRYPKEKQKFLWNPLGSHDIPRILNLLHGEGINHNPFAGRSWHLEIPWEKPNDCDTYGFRKWESEHSYRQFPEITRKRFFLASTIEYIMPGIPVIYYGTEVGMSGQKDPFCRCPYPWGYEDLVLRNHFVKLGKMKLENNDILARGEWDWQVTPTTLKMYRRSEAGTIGLIVNNSPNDFYPNENISNYKEVFSIGESSVNKVAPYGAIIYRV